jgi:hypothetical protein
LTTGNDVDPETDDVEIETNSEFDQTDDVLKITSLNVCGIKSKLKIPDFHEFIQEYDLLCVTETKMDDLDIPLILDLLPLGYTALFKNRLPIAMFKSGGTI